MTDTAVEECMSAATVCAILAPPVGAEGAANRPVRRRAERLEHDLQSSLGDAAGSGMMVGTGETYLPAFVLAAGLGDVIAGLIASVPQLAGGIAQMICPRGVRLLGSNRRWVVCSAALQGLSFVPLIIAAWKGSVSSTVVLAVATLYWSAGLASGPPWNTWMGTIVPGRVRSRYFACRTRIQQAAVLAGFLLSGLAIEYGATTANALGGFALLFALAVAARLASVACLASTSEPQPLPENVRHIPLPSLLRRFCRGAEAQRLLYLSLVQAAAYVASPYYAPYMLRVLKLTYGEYVILISTAYVARVVSVTLWGRIAVRWGVRRLLWIGGIGIVPAAGAWVFSDRLWFLILVQLLAGAAWAAYELAVFLLCFNTIRAEERTSVLALFNLSTTAGMVVGSLAGAGVLTAFGATRASYCALFGGSALLRLGTLLFLRRVPARLVEDQVRGRSRTVFPPPRQPAVRAARPVFSPPARSREQWADSAAPSHRSPA